MKTQEEIVTQAKAYAEFIGNEDGTSAFDYIMGYNNCQEDMADKIKIIAKKVWQDIFNNETLIYNNFEDYYNAKLADDCQVKINSMMEAESFVLPKR